MNDQATLYVVDDDMLFQVKLGTLARRMNLNCETFMTAEQFLHHGLTAGPLCVVSDFRLLGMSGLQMQKRLAERGIFAPMVFTIRQPDTALTVQAMQQGAITVLDKPSSEDDLQNAIKKAIDVSRRSRRLDAPHWDQTYCVSELTIKEQDVLNLILQGATNKSIAKQLGVSLRTVEVRRQHIFRKTKTRSVAELVRRVLERRVSETF